MPFNVGDAINQLSEMFLKAPLVTTAMSNPIYAALLATLVIVIIVVFVFRDADTEESLLIMGLRSGFWILIFMVGVLFLHSKILSREVDNDVKDETYEGVFTNAYIEDDKVPVAGRTTEYGEFP